jgi:hypothetical protein
MGKLELATITVLLGIQGCASGEPRAVLDTGGRNLKCARADIETKLSRETPKVKEYLVGCDFMYTRVHCDNDSCRPAPLKPPCLPNGGPCFEEDPVTLEWELERTASLER